MSVQARFFIKVLKTHSCWFWTGAVQANGYGRFKFQDKIHLAHRVSWFLAKGEWPKNLLLHKCDVRHCVNPEHLFEGDYADNRCDCVQKHRNISVAPRGEDSHLSSIGENDVREIRALEGRTSQEAIADRFGISQGTVSKIIRREIWRHV